MKKLKYFSEGLTSNTYYFQIYENGFGDELELDYNKIKKEINYLFDNNKRVEFNQYDGVGKVIKENGKYIIELWRYRSKSNPLITENIYEVIDWLFDFCS